MPTKLVHHLKAHYTPDDIKALIIADLRGLGFLNVVSADLNDVENVHLLQQAGEPFTGFYIDKEITVKPSHNSRGPG